MMRGARDGDPTGSRTPVAGSKIRCQPFLPHCRASTCDSADSVLGSCLAKIRQDHPDLAIVMAAWDRLPGAVKQGIVAMVKAVAGKSRR